jgi:hypothetical protein
MQNYYFSSYGTAVLYKLSGGKDAVVGGINPAPADFTYTSGSNNYKITYVPPAPKTPPAGFGSLRATPALPAGQYDLDYDEKTKIAALSDRNAAAAVPAAPPAPAKPAAAGGGSSAGGPTGEWADLQQFLADHLNLYFDKVDKSSAGNDQEALRKKILNGAFGDRSQDALDGFYAAVLRRIPVSQSRIFTKKDLPEAEYINDPVKLEDLKFAWVATHPADQSGFDAAAEIGFDTKISAGFFADEGSHLRKLYDMLALSPAPFVVVTTPIPAGSKIITSDGTTKNIVPFQTDFPSGAILGIGINPTDSAQVYATGEKLNTDVHGEVAKAVLSDVSAVTMQLVVGGVTYPVTGSIKIGAEVTFGNPTSTATAGPAAAAATAPDAMSLSGESRLQMNTSQGVTVGGTRPGFRLENVYMTKNNTPAMNSPQVVLQKMTGGRGDVFELSVSSVSPTDILIPIIVKSTLNEAVTHWTEKVLSALTTSTDASATSEIPHVALKQITWGYDEHFKNFGLQDPGNIRLISYEPADPGRYPGDVNVISVAEARQKGSTTESKWDPIDFAIAKYVAGYDNLVGTRLYTSSQLNRTMNSFPLAQFGNG